MNEAVVPLEEREAHMTQVAERWRELDAHGLDHKLASPLPGARERLMKRALQSKSAAQKVFWFRAEVAATVSAAAEHAACHAGCSHCCHQGVSVNSTEAGVIGRAIGREPATPPKERVLTGQDLLDSDDRAESLRRFDKIRQWQQDTYIGVPCTFLHNGRCSIYDHRPIICRMHLNMDRDALLCRLIPGTEIRAPYLNMQQEQTYYVRVFGFAGLADIRDWFPPTTTT